ncbi:MAG: penicillin-binding protein 1B [Rudaea sp.]|uniref:penicillin-binding protein 1B n=1 Tax=Rudaea sp. TaxID=2136325 RepID=UPI0039E3D039
MSFLSASLRTIGFVWRYVRVPFWLCFGFAIGFLPLYVQNLDAQLRSRFDDFSWDVPSRVYARPLELRAGTPMSAEALLLELDAARYESDAAAKGPNAFAEAAKAPGTYARNGSKFIIARRAFVDAQGAQKQRRVALALSANAVASVSDADTGAALDYARLDPARIATLYGAEQEERRVVKLEQLPPLLVAGLQAVEDREFKHHHGINIFAILRAMLANLFAGHTVQGGSTLTQQLVKNLFLDSGRRFTRKFNEAIIALLIEARYDKHPILETYCNEVFLGQQGGQAVHGFAAAAEFYFGRDAKDLKPAEIALLVGMVQGPSVYDPRRSPARALARRNVVLNSFYETGLIDADTLKSARAAPLGVPETPGLPRNRYPAFLDLVRAQLQRDYPDAQLQRAGLVVYTTLAPSTQALAEQALTKTLDGLGKRQSGTQGAMVVTGARDGEVQALVGARDPADPGFNRALDARRPIGSLVKPFVNLVALAQPDKYSLATLLDDSPVDMAMPNGSRWTPQNDDHESHGQVPLIDALAHSYNLATVHLGLALGLAKIRGLLDSFGLDAEVNPNPSLLLGAVDLSPFQVAQLYQYFAADGHALPLRALRGVVDAQGRPLARYGVKPGAGNYIQPARLVTFAMQDVAEYGTAHAISDQGLGALRAAGKTGTSDSQRDSWFAGFTGSQLAVAWIGRDDNQVTGLWGATGGLAAWIALFKRLPSAPLAVPLDGIEMVTVNPQSGERTDAQCAGARQLPFMAGFAPSATDHCVMQEIKSIFSGNP